MLISPRRLEWSSVNHAGERLLGTSGMPLPLYRRDRGVSGLNRRRSWRGKAADAEGPDSYHWADGYGVRNVKTSYILPLKAVFENLFSIPGHLILILILIFTKFQIWQIFGNLLAKLAKFSAIFKQKIKLWERCKGGDCFGQDICPPVFDYGFQKRCKGVHCVDLVKSFPTDS